MRDVQVVYDPKIMGTHGQEACRTEGIGYFRNSKNSHFQNEAKCKTFFVKMSLVSMKM